MSAYACTCMPRHMYVYAFICMYMHAYGCICMICKRICVYIHAYVCICLHAFVCIYLYEAYVSYACICHHLQAPTPPGLGRRGLPENLTQPMGVGGRTSYIPGICAPIICYLWPCMASPPNPKLHRGMKPKPPWYTTVHQGQTESFEKTSLQIALYGYLGVCVFDKLTCIILYVRGLWGYRCYLKCYIATMGAIGAF